MREIKFRAWDLKNKKIIPAAMSCIYRNRHSLYGDIYIYQAEPFGEAVRIELMQYTGLKDKNGVEIYEGDIVSFDLYGSGEIERGTIIFSKASFVAKTGYSPALDGTHHGHPLTYQLGSLIRNDKAVEVIGNIYENPDLLE